MNLRNVVLHTARLYSRDDAAAEASACHSGAVDAFLSHRFIDEEVELRHRHFVVILQRLMTLQHQLADFFVIAPTQGDGGFGGAGVLADDVSLSPEDDVAQMIFASQKLIHREHPAARALTRRCA